MEKRKTPPYVLWLCEMQGECGRAVGKVNGCQSRVETAEDGGTRGFWIDGCRKPQDQICFKSDQQSQFSWGICENASSSEAGNWEKKASEGNRRAGGECVLSFLEREGLG